MKAETVDVRTSTGRILCNTVFRPGGKKLLSKGHIISEDDVRTLQSEGMSNVWVTELEEGEVSEDEAVCTIAAEIGCGSYEIKLAAGGRANLIATEACCMLVDDDLLKQVNCTSSVVIATSVNFAYVVPGQRIATVKSAPFAVEKSDLEGLLAMLRARGPILQARPIRQPSVAVLYTDPAQPERSKLIFENIVRQRLARYNVTNYSFYVCTEDENSVVRALKMLAKSNPTAILLASTTAPACPDDVLGHAITKFGASIERFLAPVEPGNLLMLAYKDGLPILSAPGCFRSAKPNVVDLMLPPLLAQYRVSTWEIACLGHGGLLC